MTSHEFGERMSKRLRSSPIGDLAISSDAAAQLEAYYRLLARWNATINLTSLPLDEWNDQTVDRLIVEPLQASRYVPESAISWFDVGSGGGSPAIPLKILRPAAQLTMVESKARKAAFLREVVRDLKLPSAIVETGRFEDLAARPGMAGVAQLVTLRAVKMDPAMFEAVATLLGKSGALFMFTTGEPLVHPVERFEVADTVELTARPSSQLAILRRV